MVLYLRNNILDLENSKKIMLLDCQKKEHLENGTYSVIICINNNEVLKHDCERQLCAWIRNLQILKFDDITKSDL